MSERSSEQTISRELCALMEESLDVLRIYRHDVMNQVQLIRAYTQLKKYDRLEAPIHALIAEAERHSDWSSFPSALLAYVVLSRDIRYPMLQIHATYEQQEEPTPEVELVAARLLTDMLDLLGDQSKTMFEAIPVDVWIVSFRTGYEIGWFLSGQTDKKTPFAAWLMLAEKWQHQGVSLRQEDADDGIEYVMRLDLQTESEE